MRKSILFILLCISFSPVILTAQKTGGYISDEIPEKAADIYEKPGVTLSPEADAQEVMDYIKTHKEVFSQTGSDLMLGDFRESPGGFHYNFYQTFEGIRIMDASIKANLNRSKKLTSLLNNLREFTPAPVGDFAFDEAALEAKVRSDFEQGQHWFDLRISKRYQIVSNGLLPVFQVETDGPDAAWELIYNGLDMSLLRQKDRAVYHQWKPRTAADTNGTGMVFNPDPLTTAGVNYGGNYVDNNDANSTFLNLERQSVVLQDITEAGGTFFLTGPYVIIDNTLENPVKPDITSTDGNFDFLRSDDGFEGVMCYYHIDTYQRYIQSLGFNNLGNSQLKVDPHGLNGQDNSHFVPNGANSRLGFGEGGVDDAEDADVIIHEYGHALSNSGSPNTNSGTERNGLDEGIGDYVAASYSKSLNSFRWDDVFTWDGHNSFWGGRDATTSMLYPPPTSWNFYDYGEIWATALMRAWDSLGQTVSDRVFFQQLYTNGSNITLNDAAKLILDADSALYNGIHTNTYQAIFCAMNIFTGTECIVSVDDRIEEDFRWVVYPNPGSEHVTLYVPSLYSMGEVSFELFDMQGRKVLNLQAIDFETTFNVNGLPRGMYVIRLMENGVPMSSRKLLVE